MQLLSACWQAGLVNALRKLIDEKWLLEPNKAAEGRQWLGAALTMCVRGVGTVAGGGRASGGYPLAAVGWPGCSRSLLRLPRANPLLLTLAVHRSLSGGLAAVFAAGAALRRRGALGRVQVIKSMTGCNEEREKKRRRKRGGRPIKRTKAGPAPSDAPTQGGHAALLKSQEAVLGSRGIAAPRVGCCPFGRLLEILSSASRPLRAGAASGAARSASAGAEQNALLKSEQAALGLE